MKGSARFNVFVCTNMSALILIFQHYYFYKDNILKEKFGGEIQIDRIFHLPRIR